MMYVPVISNQLESPDHLSHREETKHFRGDDCKGAQLLTVEVSDLLEHVFRCYGICFGGGLSKHAHRMS